MSSGLIYSEVSLLGLLVAAFFLCSHMVSLCVCLRPDHLFFFLKKNKTTFDLFFHLFIYLFLAALDLNCFAQAFSSCAEYNTKIYIQCKSFHMKFKNKQN